MVGKKRFLQKIEFIVYLQRLSHSNENIKLKLPFTSACSSPRRLECGKPLVNGIFFMSKNKFNIQRATSFGKIGEHLAMADLLFNGYDAFLVNDPTSPFDLLLNYNGNLVKVQVKSSVGPRFGNKIKCQVPSYFFNLSQRGCGRKKTYLYDDVDMFALVCIKTKNVSYIPYSKRTGTFCLRDPTHRGDYRNEKWIKMKPIIEKYREDKLTYAEISKIMGISWQSACRYVRTGSKSSRGINDGFYFDEFPLEKCLNFIDNNKKIKTSNLLDLYFDNIESHAQNARSANVN